MLNSWFIAQLGTPVAAFAGWLIAFPTANQDEHDGHAPPPPPPAWVAALDTDANGEISAEELANATESLKKMDANNDGKLDREELRPQRPHPGPEGVRGHRRPGPGPGPGPGFERRPEERPEFGRPGFGGPGFGRPEFGRPGLGGRGFGRPGFGGPREGGPREGGPREGGPREGGPGKPPTFEQVDVNGDGVIDRNEFNAAIQREHDRSGPPRTERPRPNDRRPERERPASE